MGWEHSQRSELGFFIFSIAGYPSNVLIASRSSLLFVADCIMYSTTATEHSVVQDRGLNSSIIERNCEHSIDFVPLTDHSEALLSRSDA